MKRLQTRILTILTLCLASPILPCFKAGAQPTTIAFLGDSNLWQGGDDCSGPQAWSYWLPRIEWDGKGVLMRSFARSGATITNTVNTPVDTLAYTEILDDTNTLYQQALRLKGAKERGELPEELQTIYVAAGTNDAWFADRRPGIFDTPSKDDKRIDAPDILPSDATSFRRSLCLLLNILEKISPRPRIILVTPPYNTRVSREEIKRIGDLMEMESWRADIIRLDHDSIINPDVEAKRPTRTRDGVHTNEEGAKAIARHIFDRSFSVYDPYLQEPEQEQKEKKKH